MKTHLLAPLGLALALGSAAFAVEPVKFEPAPVPAPGIIEIGRRKQLFLDDLLIEHTTRISKFLGRPQKYAQNPVLVADQPWEQVQSSDVGMEGLQISGQNVLYDEEEKLFKMWYWATSVHSGRPVHRRRPGYAISRDGYHWEKPKLGLYEFNGSRDNNLIFPDEYDSGGYHNVIKDTREPDPQRRYKAMGILIGDRNAQEKTGLSLAFSPDGLRWTEFAGNPVVPKGQEIADVPSLLGWDASRQKYVYYPRPGRPYAPAIQFEGSSRTVRTIGYSESDDFIHWSPTRMMLGPDDNDRADSQYYQLTTAIYGDFHIGLLCMYQTHEKTFEIFLLSSRDGFHWNWVDRQRPFLPRGEIGSYDAGYQTPSGPIFHDGKVWIYYGAYSGAHSLNTLESKYGFNRFTIALATLPMDRFVGLMAGPHEGTIVTRAVSFAGSKLWLDVDGALPELTRKAKTVPGMAPLDPDESEVRVALEAPNGAAIEGFGFAQCRPISGSGVQEVTWPGADWKKIAGKPVRLRFELHNAAIYSLQFSD